MNIDDLHILLYQPTSIGPEDSSQLKQLLKDYPYFQAARSLYLKSLYVQNNHKYNNELKKTALYTLDRDVLFDFITAKDFVAYKPFELNMTETLAEVVEEKIVQPTIEEQLQDRFAKIVFAVKQDFKEETAQEFIPNITEETSTEEKEELVDEIIESIETENKIATVAIPSEVSNTITEAITVSLEEKLKVGEPLQFNNDDKFSFSEWLQLAQKKPIDREEKVEESVKKETEKTILTEETVISKTTRQKKSALIDKFIQTNPKIVPTKKLSSPPINIEVSIKENDSLMTETLAKIYLEQKKYQKAIQAYEILILKYPEKSIFFADQILDIKALQQHNS